MFEEVVAECGEAHDTTPFLSKPNFKVMQDDTLTQQRVFVSVCKCGR
jgi:hypothetical protein